MSDDFESKWYWVETVLQWPELADVKAELDDPRFFGQKHGKRGVYARGCRGPLCRKGNRDDIRRYKKEKHGFTIERPRNLQYDELHGALAEWFQEKLVRDREERANKKAS